MTFNVDETLFNPQAEALMILLNGGYLELRAGAQPANLAAAVTGDLIASVVFESPCLSAPATSGIAVAEIPLEVSVIFTGIIGWGRAFKSDGIFVFDGEVTLSGNGGDIIASILNVTIGDKVNILGFTYTRN